MPKPFIVLVLLFHCYEIQGYGYRYNFNPGTGESNLWTFLPGHEQPVVYSYSLGMFPGVDWPHVYSVPYDGLLPGQGVIPGLWATDPHLYRYKAPDGKFRYKCKPDAFWSELQNKCIWKPSYYVKKRLQQQG